MQLKRIGYNTYFQSSNNSNENLSLMLKTLGFDQLFGSNDLDNMEKWSVNELSDKDSYRLLFKKINTIKEPFFYGVYTVGTHVGLDSPDHKYGNGKNPYLNKFSNMDLQFGEFIKKFNESTISDNTTLIFTTDHASYPDKGFISTFKTQSSYFSDRIPLIIYTKGMTPSIFNAHGLNSLTLAPTILDIVGTTDVKNHFIETSLFDSGEHTIFGCTTAIGDQYLNTCSEHLIPVDDNKIISEIKKLQSLGG